MKLEIFSFLLLWSVDPAFGNGAAGVNVRNIDQECDRTPTPVTLGTSLPSLIVQRSRGAHKRPCTVTLNVVTESLLETPFKFYIKVTALNLPQKIDGECYHWLRIDGISGAPDHGVQLCGTLAEHQATGFVSVDHDIDITWNASNESSPILTQQGLNDGYFKVVITVFTEATKLFGCPDGADPTRPEISSKYHHCSNNRCIDEKLRCNRFNNCGDEEATDEQYCDFDADGGLLYIIIGIVMGGVCITIVLICFLICVNDDGDTDRTDSEASHQEEDQDGALLEKQSDEQTKERPDGKRTSKRRPSAIMNLETIDEESQDAAKDLM